MEFARRTEKEIREILDETIIEVKRDSSQLSELEAACVTVCEITSYISKEVQSSKSLERRDMQFIAEDLRNIHKWMLDKFRLEVVE